jgi:flagellar hook-basal body complex protein FliE
MNTIQPIQSIQPINSLKELGAVKTQQSDSSVAVPFQSMFEDAVSNVKQTSANLDGEINKLATGQTDNLHDALIASQKANLSVDMVVELRNKLLDSYKEIININV